MTVSQDFEEIFLKLGHILYRHIAQESFCPAIHDSNLLFHGHRRILRLNQQHAILTPFIDNHCRYGVKISSELGECFEFAILRLVYLQCTGDLLHSLYLCITTDTRYRNTYVDSRTHTLIEEGCFKENLTIGNRNHICRDISRDIASLRLDDRQGGKRTTALDKRTHHFGQVVHRRSHFVVGDNFGRTLQQTGVQIEYITGISFSTGRTT